MTTEFDISDFADDDAHRLLLEREALLAEDVRRKADRLKAIDEALKNLIDDAGPIVDEEMGVTVNYQHSVGAPEWDLNALMKVIHASDAEKLVLRVENASVKALVDTGRYTDRELAGCATRKPRRGPLDIKPLRRSL